MNAGQLIIFLEEIKKRLEHIERDADEVVTTLRLLEDITTDNFTRVLINTIKRFFSNFGFNIYQIIIDINTLKDAVKEEESE